MNLKSKNQVNIFLYFTGLLTSRLGTAIYSFAISLFVLKYTESGSLFAISLLVTMLPQVLLSPFAGAFADRGHKKAIVVSTDLLSGITMVALYFYAHAFALNLTVVYIASFLLAVFNAIFRTTFESSVPDLVTDDYLVKINSLNSIARSITNIIGPIAGGAIYALIDIKTFIIINGVSFILSAVSEMFIDFDLNTSRKVEKVNSDKSTSILSEMNEAIQYVKTNKLIMSLVTSILVVNFLASSYIVVFPYAFVNNLKGSDFMLGVANMSMALGILITSAFLAKQNEFGKPLKRLGICMAAMGLFYLLIGITMLSNHPYAFHFIIMINFMIGITVINVNIPFQVTFQREIEPAYLGRVSGLLGSVSMATVPISTILTGLFIDIYNPLYVFLFSGASLVLFSLKLLLTTNLIEKSTVQEVTHESNQVS